MGRSARTRGDLVTAGISFTVTIVDTPAPFPLDVWFRSTLSRVIGSINSFISRSQVIAIFRVAHGFPIAWRNLRLRELCRKRRAAHQHGNFDPCIFKSLAVVTICCALSSPATPDNPIASGLCSW